MESSFWSVRLIEHNGGLQPAAPAAGGAQQQPAPLKVKPKAKGLAKKKDRIKMEVRIPDLSTMWQWLQKNRETVNAKYTRMCWRRRRAASGAVGSERGLN